MAEVSTFSQYFCSWYLHAKCTWWWCIDVRVGWGGWVYCIRCDVYSIAPTAVCITAVCFISFSLAATMGDTRTFLVLGGERKRVDW